MSTCCVSGCKYRYTPGSNIKLYRIPSGSRPYHANKRRLWLEAIQRANGSTEPIKDTARVCSAHFISGEASMEYGMPDFVPSVFTCAERSATPKKKVRWSLRTAKVRGKVEEKTTPPEVDSPVDLQSSVLMETETELLMETQTPPTPSVPKEEETSTKQAENETRAVQLQTSNTNMTSPSFKAPAGIAKLLLRSPIVLLKPIVSPAGGYQCDQCNLTFPIASQLIKHKQLHEEQKSLICAKCFPNQTALTEHHAVHEEEPSFPCNICDRSFPTSRSLKRHKLLHVRDGRKCLTCGALFCRRHRHLSFLPKIECKTGSEEESSITEQQHVGSNLIPENDLPNQSIEESVPGESSPVPDESSPGPSKSSPVPDESSPGPSKSSPVPGESSPVSDNAQNTQIFTLLLTSSTSTSAATPSTSTFSTKTSNAPHPPLHTSDLPKIPTRVLPEPSSMPPPPPAIIRYRGQGTSFKYRSSVPATFNQPQCPELPPSLKIFSPQYLTSALLEVKRNYEYIFSKSKDVKMKPIVKEEPAEPLMVSKDEQTITNKKERIAYDLEIVL